MKLIHKLVGILLIVCYMFSLEACNSNLKRFGEEMENKYSLEMDTLSISKTEYLQNDTSSSSCNINIMFVYPIKGEKTNIEKLQRIFITTLFGSTYEDLTPQEAMNTYVENYIVNYKKDASIFQSSINKIEILESLSPDSVDTDYSDLYNSYFETLKDSITYQGNSLLSFQVKQSISKDGKSSYDLYRNRVIDMKTDSLISESDIFTPGYEHILRQLFIATLQEQNNVTSISELEDFGFFGTEEISPNNNFYINDKGITYTFNKGEYSAYQLDAPVIFIPYQALKPILKENTAIWKLGSR